MGFKCLRDTIMVNEGYDYLPYYVIELGIFMRVIHTLGIMFSREDIIELGKVTYTIGDHKDYGTYIIYDIFLASIRDASLTKYEIEYIVLGSNNNNNNG